MMDKQTLDLEEVGVDLVLITATAPQELEAVEL